MKQLAISVKMVELNMTFNFRGGCVGGAVLVLTACAQPAAPDIPPIAALHSSRCGRCHVPPEPQTHTRAELETAFGRHRSRVHLSQDEWQAMVDFLAVRRD